MLWTVILILVVLYLTLDRVLRRFKVGNYSSKYVFITGCDSGFGRELAIRLDKLGFPVFAGCLSQNGKRSLEEICSSRVVTFTLDVADKNSIQEALKFVRQQLPHENSLWAVVNNAGVTGVVSKMEMISLDTYVSTCDVNLFGPIEVSRVFAPLLRKSRGRLIFMTSIMGRCPATPAPYAVSKFGLEAFGDVCRRELAPFGVKVCLIEPGYFKTSLLNEELILNGARSTYTWADPEVRAAYGNDYLDKVTALISDMKNFASPNIYKVIDAYVSALTSVYPRPRYVVGTDAKLVFLPLSFLPEWVMDTFLARNEKTRIAKFQQGRQNK